MLSKQGLRKEGVSSCTISSSASLSSSTVMHCGLKRSCASIQAYTFSIKLRSGLLAGHHSKAPPGTSARTVLRLSAVVCCFAPSC